MKLFITYKKLYIDGDLLGKVSGKLPPLGKYRIDISQCPKLQRMTPVLPDGTRIYWDNIDRDLSDCILLEYEHYIELYKKIVDSINSGDDVILTL